MEIYENEDEQLEALKRWWKENGKSIIGGLVLGLAGVLGWQAWQSYQVTRSEEGAQRFGSLVISMRQHEIDRASDQARQLMQDYENEAYGVFAAWAMARQNVTLGDLESATSSLQWAIEHSPDDSLKSISRLRLVRVLLAIGRLDEAEKIIGASRNQAFAAEFSMLSGDIQLARGKPQLARQAYQQALLEGVKDRNLLEMKLNDLGDAGLPAAVDAS
ncbi:MAG: tetratricopeptide repeat protein [gamma proteobacterium symbiont of Bathyaustriella thionipta]|nr:tetratricopeptide repeat protein [gamma proteobacterium symbiont of Bathyaustriella thionipta]